MWQDPAVDPLHGGGSTPAGVRDSARMATVEEVRQRGSGHGRGSV